MCEKNSLDGRCCCNCKNHHEDFYHCTSSPKPENIKNCVCNIHKGWICIVAYEGGVERAYSGWSEHGICELHEFKKA